MLGTLQMVNQDNLGCEFLKIFLCKTNATATAIRSYVIEFMKLIEVRKNYHKSLFYLQ